VPLRDIGRIRWWLVALGLLAALGAAPFPPGSGDAVEFDKATRTILCDCGCHPQSVHECACGRAAELREEIAGMIRSGHTADEVIQDFVARKGEQVRIAPLARGFNLVAWIGPTVLFFVAAAGVALLLVRWKRGAPAARTEAGPGIDPDDPYLARLREDLEKYS
jgi:cytochrome c-type biogenesis protein CcmH/NrfF